MQPATRQTRGAERTVDADSQRTGAAGRFRDQRGCCRDRSNTALVGDCREIPEAQALSPSSSSRLEFGIFDDRAAAYGQAGFASE